MKPETEWKLVPHIKRSWIKALLSRRYKQTNGGLRKTVEGKDPKYCCLGVLCNIRKDVKMVKSKYKRTTEFWSYKFENDTKDGIKTSGSLPSAFRRKIGMPTDVHSMLIRMNDTDKRSFEFIAGYIEAAL